MHILRKQHIYISMNYTFKYKIEKFSFIVKIWFIWKFSLKAPYILQLEMSKTSEKKSLTPSQRYYRSPANFNYMTEFNYQIQKEIGRGGYGVVYKASDCLISGQEYAIKINFNTVSREIVYAQMAYLELVNGKKNLPKLKNIFVYQDSAHIVLEYFPFRPFITLFNTFNMEDVKHYLFQLLLGLKSLKQLGIFHRDIKPGNFLYNPTNKKGIIVDFGLAQLDKSHFFQLFTEVQRLKTQKNPKYDGYKEAVDIYRHIFQSLEKTGYNKIGTEGFIPLQTILHDPGQSYSSDIWAVGVIMLQFVLKKYNVFNSLKLIHNEKDIKNRYLPTFLIELSTLFGSDRVCEECKKMGYELTLPQDCERVYFKDIASINNFDQKAQDLLLKLLDLSHKTRISVQNALIHPFFDNVRDQH